MTATTASPRTPAAPAVTPAPAAPSVHSRVLLTWAAVWTMITTVQFLLGPSLIRLALPVRTLILTGIVVPVVVYILVPALLRAHTAVTRRAHQ